MDLREKRALPAGAGSRAAGKMTALSRRKTKMRLLSVVLSGGAGSRLWPASRQAFPKPFMKLGGSTLLQQAIERGQACGTGDLMIVTNKDHQFLTKDVLQADGRPPVSHHAARAQGPQHGAGDRAGGPAVRQAVRRRHGDAGAVGRPPGAGLSTPSWPAPARPSRWPRKVSWWSSASARPAPTPASATSKSPMSRATASGASASSRSPISQTAQEYLATGRYYWNSGMFCFTADAIVAAFEQHAPRGAAPRRAAPSIRRPRPTATRAVRPACLRPAAGHQHRLRRHGTRRQRPCRAGQVQLERRRHLALGGQRRRPPTPAATRMPPDSLAIDTTGTHVQIDSHGPKVVATLGVHDLVIVDTPDALLVAHKDKAQGVKQIVDALKARKHETHQPAGGRASPLGHLRIAQGRERLQGQADHGEARRIAVAAIPPPARRTLGGRARHGAGPGRRRRAQDARRANIATSR